MHFDYRKDKDIEADMQLNQASSAIDALFKLTDNIKDIEYIDSMIRRLLELKREVVSKTLEDPQEILEYIKRRWRELERDNVYKMLGSRTIAVNVGIQEELELLEKKIRIKKEPN